jgi:hypothetical protein
MKISKQKRQVLRLLALALLVAIAIGIVWAQKRQLGSPKASPAVTKGNSVIDEPSPSPSPKGSPTPVVAKPSKPTLQKSSGNAPGSSVPDGAIVEFSCEGTANVFCEIQLTDQSNHNNIITLDKKPIASNGRGQYFAIWDWTAVKGSWKVVAKASNSNGETALSDEQTLEVK